MKLWFGTTTLKFTEYKDYYFKIRQHLIDSGNELTDDWIKDHGTWIINNPKARRGIKDIYHDVINAIDSADASVIEFTVPNFSSSHQITYSIQKRKPTLVLRLKSDNVVNDAYIDAIESPYLTVEEYSLSNYKQIIDEFLGFGATPTTYKRYNIMLEHRQKEYLDWASKKFKKSKSEIIRELINTEENKSKKK